MFESNDIAYRNSTEIEGATQTRQNMVDVVNEDDGKGGTSPGNNREYGGTVSSNGAVIQSPPGPVSDPATDSHAEIEITIDRDTRSMFHSHPSGSVVVSGNSSSHGTSSGSTVNMSQTQTTSYFTQSPSSTDIENAGSRTNYVFGRGDGTVYIYNSQGVRATIPQKRFVNLKQ